MTSTYSSHALNVLLHKTLFCTPGYVYHFLVYITTGQSMKAILVNLIKYFLFTLMTMFLYALVNGSLFLLFAESHRISFHCPYLYVC